jgi:peptidoglycan/LPS O-acetylase OafA/YrhL
MSTDPAKQARKRSIVTTLLYVEGCLVLSLGVWVAIMGITHEDREIPPLMGVLGFIAIGGTGLLACGRALAIPLFLLAVPVLYLAVTIIPADQS